MFYVMQIFIIIRLMLGQECELVVEPFLACLYEALGLIPSTYKYTHAHTLVVTKQNICILLLF